MSEHMAKTAPKRRATAARRNDALRAEVLVVGGGMVGLTLGVALAGAHIPVVVVDREAPAETLDAAFDGRSSAIARGSQQLLKSIGLWDGMADQAEPIWEIRVSDGRPGLLGGLAEASPFFLHYDSAEVGDQPLGYIVENRAIRTASQAIAAALPKLTLLAPMTVGEIERTAKGVTAVLSDGRKIQARLLVAADGRRSPIREAAGIAVRHRDYGQNGIVCTVAHERPHNGVAHEHFLPSGPFALLPMTDLQESDSAVPIHRSSLVWTERRELVPRIMALDDGEFSREMMRRFGDTLGPLQVIGKRWSYPLSLMLAERYVDRRLALIGDAAHGIHPIAGQGLNLGLRDVAALAEALVDTRRLGLDLGDAATLQRYERWRRFDNTTLALATDLLNQMFRIDAAPVRLLRDLGLAAVNQVPPLKRVFMRHAMGLLGELPRLIQGKSL